mgnify:CR=1 FL=1
MKLYRQPFTASIKSQSGSDRKESNGGNKKQIIKIQDYGQHQGKQGVPARQRLGKSSERLRRFAAAIPEMHPTLQQSLYRLVKECIVVMADETRNYDDRNRASHEEAKCIMEYLKANGRHIPLR